MQESLRLLNEKGIRDKPGKVMRRTIKIEKVKT